MYGGNISFWLLSVSSSNCSGHCVQGDIHHGFSVFSNRSVNCSSMIYSYRWNGYVSSPDINFIFSKDIYIGTYTTKRCQICPWYIQGWIVLWYDTTTKMKFVLIIETILYQIKGSTSNVYSFGDIQFRYLWVTPVRMIERELCLWVHVVVLICTDNSAE